MKKSLVIGMIALLFSIALTPCINANVVKTPVVISKNIEVTEKNTINDNGTISGDVVTPGFSLFVGVPGIRMACGKNYDGYVTTVTDDGGEFEFTDLPYEDSGTVYRVFMLKTPGIIHVLQKKRVALDSENPEAKIRFILPFVFSKEVRNVPVLINLLFLISSYQHLT